MIISEELKKIYKRHDVNDLGKSFSQLKVKAYP